GSAPRRVLVVDADVAGRRLTRMTGVSRPRRPLDDLVGGVPVEEVTTRWTAGGDQVVDVARLGTSALRQQGGATVLHRCLELVAGSYDLVLFTAGPIFTDPVAFSLLREAGSVVLVVDRRAGKRLAPTLASFRYRLQLADRSCDGVIVARQHRSRGTSGSPAPAEPPAARGTPRPEARPRPHPSPSGDGGGPGPPDRRARPPRRSGHSGHTVVRLRAWRRPPGPRSGCCPRSGPRSAAPRW
ncbi:hypothetical protein A7K94_0217995, partial [Modestobacter sp. VKM Ac-2676]